MRNIDRHDLLDGGGAGAHDHDPIGELHRLVDIVRDEDDGLSLRLPDAQQLAAHLRRVIESSAPNGSSRKSMSGLTARARATSRRCFMPPESSEG